MIYKESHRCHTTAERDKPEQWLQALDRTLIFLMFPMHGCHRELSNEASHKYLSRNKELPQCLGKMVGAEDSPERKWLRDQLSFWWRKVCFKQNILHPWVNEKVHCISVSKGGGWGLWHDLYDKSTNGLDLIGLPLFSAGSTVRSHH